MTKWTVFVPYTGVYKYFNVEAATEKEAVEEVMERSGGADDDEGRESMALPWAEEEKEA